MIDHTQYALLTEASDASPAALDRPHRELQNAVLHYLHHRNVLVTFTEKVKGTPVVGVPPEVESDMEALSRRRICRQTVTVGQYLDMFQLEPVLQRVTTFLRGCVESASLMTSSQISALRVGGLRVEVGHLAAQMISSQDGEEDMIEIQDALCLLSSAVVKRFQDVSLLTGTPVASLDPSEVASFSAASIRTALRQTVGPDDPQLRQQRLSALLLQTKAVQLEQAEWPAISFRWSIPPQLNLQCAAWVPRRPSDKVSWISWGNRPAAAHFNYPKQALVDQLQVELRWNDKEKVATLEHLEPVLFRTASPLSSVLLPVFTWLSLACIGAFAGIRPLANTIATLWAVSTVWEWCSPEVASLGRIMSYWEHFETDEASESEEEGHESEEDSEEGEGAAIHPAPEDGDYVRLPHPLHSDKISVSQGKAHAKKED